MNRGSGSRSADRTPARRVVPLVALGVLVLVAGLPALGVTPAEMAAATDALLILVGVVWVARRRRVRD